MTVSAYTLSSSSGMAIVKVYGGGRVASKVSSKLDASRMGSVIQTKDVTGCNGGLALW